MKVDELRQAFLTFFEERGHRRIPSSSLIPHGDPTLLFTTAGMVQFKPYFMGLEDAPASRLTSIQRCFRTTDIEEVGDDNPLTMFEMLGNFSIGDYFKDDAILFGWEVSTEVFGLDPEQIWITVFAGMEGVPADDEALTAWMQLDPQSDVQHLRALIRQARKDAQATQAQERPGEAVRHGKAYREIFQIVKTTLNQDGDNTPDPPDDEDQP